MSVTITTFGVLHDPEPAAANPVRVDLTTALRNPADDPRMIQMTGLDTRVRDHVMNTPGADVIRDQALGLIEVVSVHGAVDVLVYCRGGKHRSVAMGEELCDALTSRGVAVRVVHRDVEKAVVR